MSDNFLSARDVSRYLSIPLRTVQRLSKEGKIRAIKIGNKWKYSREDIDRYRNFGTDFSREPSRRSAEIVERRAYPRINCSLRCDYSINIPPFKSISQAGFIRNISAGGILLVGSIEQIDVDDPVELFFSLGRISGRVVRKDKIGIGIRFRNISDEDKDRIIKYVG